MSRPHNPDNRYSITCKVTGNVTKTNPKQFGDLVKRYEITPAEMDTSYISREGRSIIEKASMTPQEVMDAYGVHPNVANALKCCRPKKAVTQRKNRETVVVATESVSSVELDGAIEPLAQEQITPEPVTTTGEPIDEYVLENVENEQMAEA